MSNLRKAAQQGLEALEDPWKAGAEGVADAIVALRAALAEPERYTGVKLKPVLYTPRRLSEEEVLACIDEMPLQKPLTDEAIDQIAIKCLDAPEPGWNRNLARAIEWAHGIR